MLRTSKYLVPHPRFQDPFIARWFSHFLQGQVGLQGSGAFIQVSFVGLDSAFVKGEGKGERENVSEFVEDEG